MKTLEQINTTLRAFEKIFGMPVVGAQQGSATWLQMKLGVLSASNASKIVAKRDSETRATYMAELVAQIATGIMEELNTRYTEYGKEHEDAARSAYEFSQDVHIEQLPFVFKDVSFREGASPDGLVGNLKPFEIKCPFNSVHHIKFITDEKIKPEYKYQFQYIMRILEADQLDFASFDPRMHKFPLKVLTINRDDEIQKAFDDLVPAFMMDMDKMLDKIGIKHGEQWLRIAHKK